MRAAGAREKNRNGFLGPLAAQPALACLRSGFSGFFGPTGGNRRFRRAKSGLCVFPARFSGALSGRPERFGAMRPERFFLSATVRLWRG